MPGSSIDTFFACIILVAAAVIATSFMAGTLYSRINAVQDVNQDSYLKAIADRLIADAGNPTDWGTKNGVPTDFGLAVSNPSIPFELDQDKISRLNGLNNKSLSYFGIIQSAKLYNIALKIAVSQVMDVSIQQTKNVTGGGNISFTFSIAANTNSIQTSATMHGYVRAQDYQAEIPSTLMASGSCKITVPIPTAKVDNALMVIFARSNIDERVTSYAIYSFNQAIQQITPSGHSFGLSPLNYALSFNNSAPGLSLSRVDILSYSYQQAITSFQGSQCNIPRWVEPSPIIVIASGTNGGVFLEEWTAYPQIPVQTGAGFQNSEQNIYSYLVSVNRVLYRVDISLGEVVY